jgi:hypothetical protein
MKERQMPLQLATAAMTMFFAATLLLSSKSVVEQPYGLAYASMIVQLEHQANLKQRTGRPYTSRTALVSATDGLLIDEDRKRPRDVQVNTFDP